MQIQLICLLFIWFMQLNIPRFDFPIEYYYRSHSLIILDCKYCFYPWFSILLTLAHNNIDLSPQSRTNFSADDNKLSVSVFNDAVAIVMIENKTQIFFILFIYFLLSILFKEIIFFFNFLISILNKNFLDSKFVIWKSNVLDRHTYCTKKNQIFALLK